jgi:predicted ATPase
MTNQKLVRTIRLSNFLSYGQNEEIIELGPLNVLIGPNCSGKSNLIEAFGLLQTTPKDLTAPIREGGGVSEWIYKRDNATPVAEINVTVNCPHVSIPSEFGETSGKSRTKRDLRREDLDIEQSVLSQRKDPDQYPELTYLANQFSKIKLYREWNLGRFTPPRL